MGYMAQLVKVKAVEQPTKASSARASAVTIQVMPECLLCTDTVEAVWGGVGRWTGSTVEWEQT